MSEPLKKRKKAGVDGFSQKKLDAGCVTGCRQGNRSDSGLQLSRSHLLCLYKTDINFNLHRLTAENRKLLE